MKKKSIEITAEEFDRRFDNGEDMTPFLDFSKAKRINLQSKVVNVNFPVWMVTALDREAAKLGITRQALIKVVVNDHLQAQASAQESVPARRVLAERRGAV